MLRRPPRSTLFPNTTLFGSSSRFAELVVTRDAYSDVFARLRRRRELSLAAEVQWELLPPLTYASDRVVVTGALEPTYEIGGGTLEIGRALGGGRGERLGGGGSFKK